MLAVSVELLRRHEALDRQVIRRRAQVLAQRQQVDADRAQVVHRRDDLGVGLAEAEHQARLDEHVAADAAWRAPARASVWSYDARGSRTGCVSRRTVSTFCANTSRPLSTTVSTSRQHALEIRRQRLDRGLRVQPLDLAHAGGEMRGAAVRQVVAVDRRQHDVLQAHELHGARGVGGLVGIEPAARIAGIDRAEAAGARADLAHQHDAWRCPRSSTRRCSGTWLPRRPWRGDARAPSRGRRRSRAPAGIGARSQARLAASPARDVAARGRLDAVLDRRKALRGHVFLAAAGGGRRRAVTHGNALELAHLSGCVPDWRVARPAILAERVPATALQDC